jgi:hypothetical protein
VLILAAIAATATPTQAQVSVRIVRGQRIDREEWERSQRRREIVVEEGGRKVTLRLIDFE